MLPVSLSLKSPRPRCIQCGRAIQRKIVPYDFADNIARGQLISRGAASLWGPIPHRAVVTGSRHTWRGVWRVGLWFGEWEFSGLFHSGHCAERWAVENASAVMRAKASTDFRTIIGLLRSIPDAVVPGL